MEEVFGNADLILDVDNLTENGIENFDALKAAVLEDVSIYAGLVVQEDSLDDAAKFRAELNRKAKNISDFRISFEKEYKKKIEKSVVQLKELTAVYSDAASAIDEQVKTFDEKRKSEKKQQIQVLFDEIFGDWKSVLDVDRLERYSDGKWMNKGTAVEAIRTFMLDTRKKIEDGVRAIKGLGSKHEREMIWSFLQKLDMSDALNKKAEMDEFERQLEVQRIEKEKKAKDQEKDQDNRQDETKEAETKQGDEKEYRIAFEVRGTKDELMKIIDFLKASGLSYKKL